MAIPFVVPCGLLSKHVNRAHTFITDSGGQKLQTSQKFSPAPGAFTCPIPNCEIGDTVNLSNLVSKNPDSLPCSPHDDTEGNAMTEHPTHQSANPHGNQPHQIADWADLGQEMWSYLTGRGAAVDYQLVNMTVEVPRDIGPDAPRAVWKFDGTLRVTTSDEESS